MKLNRFSGSLRRYWFAVAMTCILAVMALASCTPHSTATQTQINDTPIVGSKKVELSMEDAMTIGLAEADELIENPMITEVHSYDNDSARNTSDGGDGDREWWYVSLANENLDYIDILIADGEIVSTQKYENNGNNGLIALSDVKMTAKEAVYEAKQLGMRGGDPDNEEKEWISGFHFKLECSSLVTTPGDQRIFLEIIGISPNGYFAHIDFDATTKEILLAEEKIEHANGNVEWKSFR